MGQVVQTDDPTQFDEFKDKNDIDYLPGSIIVRLRGTGHSIAQEVNAIPANPNFLHVPLYGEQVIVFNAKILHYALPSYKQKQVLVGAIK